MLEWFVPLLTQPETPWFSAGFILIWAFGQWLIFRFRHLALLHRQLEGCLALLEKTPDDALSFAPRFPEINQRLTEFSLLTPFWESFRSTFIFPQGDGPIIGCRRAEQFFIAEGILAKRADLRLYRAMPGFLVGSGMLLTFVGLIAASLDVAQGISATDPREVQLLLQEALHSTALQFIPAIAAILVALTFSWREKRQIRRLQEKTGQLCRLLDGRIALVTQEQLVYSQLLESKAQTNRLKQLSVQLDRPITFMDATMNGSIRVSSHPPIETILHVPSGGGGFLPSQQMEEMMASFAQQWKLQVGGETEVLRQTCEHFSLSLRNGALAIDQQLTTILRDLGEQIGHLRHACDDAVGELRALNTPFSEISDQLRETHTNLNAMNETMSSIGGALPTTARQLADSNACLNQLWEGYQERVRNMEHVASVLSEIRTDVAGFPDLVAEFMEKKASLAALAGRLPPPFQGEHHDG